MVKEISNKVIKLFQFSTSKIEFWENGLVYIEIKPNTEIDLDISTTHHQTLRDNFDGTNLYYILVDPGKFTTVTKDARDFSARPESNDMSSSVAVISHSLAQRIMINFHSKFISRQKMKMKAFQTKDDAVNWLLDRKNKKL